MLNVYIVFKATTDPTKQDALSGWKICPFPLPLPRAPLGKGILCNEIVSQKRRPSDLIDSWYMC